MNSDLAHVFLLSLVALLNPTLLAAVTVIARPKVIGPAPPPVARFGPAAAGAALAGES